MVFNHFSESSIKILSIGVGLLSNDTEANRSFFGAGAVEGRTHRAEKDIIDSKKNRKTC